MRLTRHNGRSGKDGTYNPKHNDRNFDIENSDHIDEKRAEQNVYWDCFQGYHFPRDQDQEGKSVYSFEQIEQIFYERQYSKYCEGQHERNRKNGHPERNRTTEDLRLNKKTCPEESLLQIGTVEKTVEPEVLAKIAAEFFEEFNKRFGDHVHILDWSLHLDEATPHIHERHVFDCLNAYGEVAPQQGKALDALGFDLPEPDKKASNKNNRKKTFDAACRAMLFDIALRHGLHLEQEPEYGGRDYLEKQDFILMKQKEKITDQERQIESMQAELEAVTIRIEDTEAFIDRVADAAYEKAVEVVTNTVQEKVRNDDFDIISEHRKEVLEDPRLSDHSKKYAGNLFSDLMKRFRGMTEYISERLSALFRDPVRKEEYQKPIKQSIRDLLNQSKREAETYNAERAAKRGQTEKQKKQNMVR